MLKPEQVFGCAPDYLGDLGRIVMAPELVSPKMNRIYYLVEEEVCGVTLRDYICPMNTVENVEISVVVEVVRVGQADLLHHASGSSVGYEGEGDKGFDR